MFLYAATISVSAFLLFQVQPMIARMILPWFGGGAAVWITCMLFFQVGLLAGYAYSHASIRLLSPRFQTFVHILLLIFSLLLLPLMPDPGLKPPEVHHPLSRILWLLLWTVGLPYFLLSSTTPLIQAWYARRHEKALPYRLFSLSNLASLAGLLAYPFLIEPGLALRSQALAWSALYGLFVLLCTIGAIRAAQDRDSPPHGGAGPSLAVPSSRIAPSEWVSWIVLPACASILLLSVTNHLTQNVAPIPLLWILPLGLYLLTFVLCFEKEGWYNTTRYSGLAALALVGMSYGLRNWDAGTRLYLVIPCYSLGLFLCCIFCHGELSIRKPPPARLTTFYLLLTTGGAVGGLFVGLAAPFLFPGYFELAAGLVLCAVLLFFIHVRKGWIPRILLGALAIEVTWVSALAIVTPLRESREMVRNFYGSLRVKEYDAGLDNECRALIHGTVTHGLQFTRPERTREPTTYYGRSSGVGLALAMLEGKPRRVGIVGLGAGTLACYAGPGDVYRFYEINPLVADLAQREFTFLEECEGETEVSLGDGRLLLEQEPDQHYDLLVVDAFSGDSIPIHLLTVEAVRLYFRHLKQDGILALHTSNTHLDLTPVVERIAARLGKNTFCVINPEESGKEIYGADWVLLTSNEDLSENRYFRGQGGPLQARPGIEAWTDDYSNLIQILK
jgi:hypothetical protein